MSLRHGAVAVIVVLLISVMGMFVLVGWQSRLLLAIQRTQTGSDALKSTYSAESEIYDWVARFLGSFPQIFPSPLTATTQVIREGVLGDGTSLRVTGQLVGSEEILLVTARRQFAQTNIEVARQLTLTEESDYDSVEIAISLDCSGSMNQRADPACSGSCTSRMTEARSAVVNFLDRVAVEQAAGRGEFFVGLNVYKRQSYWPQYAGVPLTPTADIAFMQEAAQNVLGSTTGSSSACGGVPHVSGGGGETNIGDGAVDLARYLQSTAEPRKKQVMILITDGLPNWSLADSQCETPQGGCSEGGSCTVSAIRYLTCGVADTDTPLNWGTPGRVGLRRPGTDVYAVTVASPQNNNEIQAFNQTLAVFSNPVYVTGYYANANATQLGQFLEDIFGEIIEGSQSVRIRRVVVTPTP